MPFINDEQDIYHDILNKRREEEELRALQKSQTQHLVEPKIEEEGGIRVKEEEVEEEIQVEDETRERVESWLSSSSSQSSNGTLVAPLPFSFKPSAKHEEDMKEFAAFFEENEELYAAIKPEEYIGGRKEIPQPTSKDKPRKKRRLGIGRPPVQKVKKSLEETKDEQRARERAENMDKMRNGEHRELYLPFLDQLYIPPSLDDEGEY